MTPKQVLARLKALGNERVCALAVRQGAGTQQFGVQLGEIRKLAKELKIDHTLALSLWETGNADARLLAILALKSKALAADELDAMVRSVRCEQVADWLNSYVVKKHPDKEALRLRWMDDADPMAARSGWTLTSEAIRAAPQSVDLPALLERIEA